MAQKISATIGAWLPDHADSRLLDREDHKQILSGLGFATSDMTTHGWTRIGEATISIDLIDKNELVEAQITALRASIAEVRADSQMKITQLEGRISNLLAIGNDVEVAA